MLFAIVLVITHVCHKMVKVSLWKQVFADYSGKLQKISCDCKRAKPSRHLDQKRFRNSEKTLLVIILAIMIAVKPLKIDFCSICCAFFSLNSK